MTASFERSTTDPSLAGSWVGIALCLEVIAIYLWSNGLSLQPGLVKSPLIGGRAT